MENNQAQKNHERKFKLSYWKDLSETMGELLTQEQAESLFEKAKRYFEPAKYDALARAIENNNAKICLEGVMGQAEMENGMYSAYGREYMNRF